MPSAGGRAGPDHFHVAAPLAGQQVLSRQLLQSAVGIGAGQVDLVQGHDDRHVRRLGVADRLFGLRHHAVVRGHDQDHDVGDVGAAGPHLGEGFVARRIDEGDGAAVLGDAIGADVLRDAAGFAGDDVDADDVVQQRRLAVVHVSEERDHRRAGRQQRGIFVRAPRSAARRVSSSVGGCLNSSLEAEFRRHQLGHLVVELGVDIQGGDAHAHEGLEHLPRTHARGLGEAADRAGQLHRDHFPARRRRAGAVPADQGLGPPHGGNFAFFLSLGSLGLGAARVLRDFWRSKRAAAIPAMLRSTSSSTTPSGRRRLVPLPLSGVSVTASASGLARPFFRSRSPGPPCAASRGPSRNAPW